MKKTLIIVMIAAAAVSCGPAAAEKVTPPDMAVYKTLEISVKSNSDRVTRLETELQKANKEIASLRTQNRQLTDSYDELVNLFKEHKNLTMVLIDRMNSLFGSDEEAEKKK